MKKTLILAGALLAAAAPGSARQADEALLLKSRRVELRIRENLALVRFELVVENASARPREGELPFAAPEGAAVFETTLAKNVSSRDRVSKLLAAGAASDAYAAVKKEGGEADAARQSSDPSGANLLAGGVPNVPRTPTPGPVAPDPALLELIAGSSYRLRFYPVMPRDDQKLSVTLAVEAARVGDELELRIPLAETSGFRRRKETPETLKVSVAGAVEGLSSTSHELRRAASGFEAELGSGKELVLRYRPGAKAQPVDVAAEPPASFRTEEWGRAIRALREVRGLHRGEPAAVTRENSILVIDRAELRRVLKSR
jgi:hypothetical protein